MKHTQQEKSDLFVFAFAELSKMGEKNITGYRIAKHLGLEVSSIYIHLNNTLKKGKQNNVNKN